MGPTLRARLLLVGIQAYIIVLTLLIAFFSGPWNWLSWVPGNFGLLSCKTQSGPDIHCWQDQLVYRVQFAGFISLLVVVVLAAGGCGSSAQSPYVLGAVFGAILAVQLVFWFCPNSIFDVFGDVAVVVSSVFLIGQTILLADLGYRGNDYLMGAARSANRRNFSSAPERQLKATLIGISALALFLAVAGAIILTAEFTHGWMVLIILFVSAALLFASITECIPHGNLLTSSLVTAYFVWLSYECLITQPVEHPPNRSLFWKVIGLFIAICTLGAAAFGKGLGIGGPIEEPLADVESGTVEANTLDFTKQSVLHMLATMYVTTELAPSTTMLGFVFRCVALGGSVIIYAWTLAAPLILKDRF